MFKNTAKGEIRVIVMDGFGSEVGGLFDRLGIDVICCGDVYSALAEIIEGRRIGGKFLVIGSLARLCAEDMRFLQICADRNDTRCCCFVDDNAGCGIKTMVEMLGLKAFIAEDVNDVESILAEMTEEENASQEKCVGEQRNIDKKEFALTRAEIDALCRAG